MFKKTNKLNIWANVTRFFFFLTVDMDFNITYGNTSFDEIFQKAFHVRIPTIAFLSFLMPVGIFGNFLVFYIYGIRLKRNNLHLFITLLAFLDILICLVGFPLEIVELRTVYAYPYRYLCKFQKFITYYYCVSSALVLLTISVERYFLVCRATKPQMTPVQARLLVGGLIIVSGFLVIPVTASFDMASQSLTPNVTITQCDFRRTPWAWAYYVSLFPANLSILILMFVLYYKLWKTARRHFAQKGQSRNLGNCFDQESNRELASRRKLTRTNRTMISITVAYAVSFFPTLLVGVTSYFFHDAVLTPVQEAIISFLYRSWILNGALNPAVYGFCNKKFRGELLKVFKNMSPCPRKEAQRQDINGTLNTISSSTTINE